MNKISIIILAILFTMPAISEDAIQNPSNHPVIGFINKEKFRVSVREVVDRYLHPEKYSDKDIVAPIDLLMATESEKVVSARSFAESEVHSAISPINPDIMVVSPIRQVPSDPSRTVTCPVYYSTDRGETWGTSTFVTKPYSQQVLLAGGGDPVFVFDKKGDLYFSWINLYITTTGGNPDSLHAALFWAKSTDGGKTFEFDEKNYFGDKIFSSVYSNQPVISGMLDKQWMAADMSNLKYKNSIYTSALYLDNSTSFPTLQMQVYHKRENDVQFNRKPAIINTNGMAIVQFGSIDTDNRGRVHLTFYASTINVTMQQGLYHTVSLDGGVSFEIPKRISFITGSMRQMTNTESVPGISSQRMYPSPYMVVDRSKGENDGNIYITWSANGINSKLLKGMDIYFSKSTDGGANWSEPIVVNDDNMDGVHNFYSNIAVNQNGIIAVSFYDRRRHQGVSGALTDYYIGISHDGGNTFKNHLVSSTPSRFSVIGSSNNGFGIGEYNSIMMTEDYAYPIWADGRTNNGNINIYMAKVSLDQNAASVTEVSTIHDYLTIQSISPNPASNFVNVSFESKLSNNAQFEVIDLLGNVIFTSPIINIIDGKGIYQIDLTSFSSGVYSLRLISGNTFVAKQFNIQR